MADKVPLRYGLILAFALLLAGMQICRAQQTISGKVISKADKSPVAGAFIFAYGGEELNGYAMSDGEGVFSVTLPEGKKADRLTVSCLGFDPATASLDGRTGPYEIYLSENHASIKEAKVQASVIEEQGDTVTYTAGAFADGSERVLGDLLEKIPGITVTRSGGILYNGSYINKFYIEGLDLIGSEYGVLIKNLSTDKIAKVEVYKHHQPIRTLVGINETDRSAVNIVLKENARSTWMITGDIIGGAPDFPRIDAKAMLSRFSKKSQDLYLLKGNNVGGDIIKELTRQQYMGRTGAFLISDESLDADFNSRLNPRRSHLQLPQEYWNDNLSGIASFNHLSKIGSDRELRISVQGAAERYKESSESTQTINFSDSDSLVIQETDQMRDTKYYVSGKVDYEKNASSQYIRNQLSFSGQLRDNDGSGNGYSQRYDLPAFKIENDLKGVFRFSDKSAFSLQSLTSFVSNNHEADFSTSSFSAHQDLIRNSLSSYNNISSHLVWKGIGLDLSGGVDFEYTRIDAQLHGINMSGLVSDASGGLFSLSPSLSMSTRFFMGKTEARLSLPARLVIVNGGFLDKSAVYPTLAPSLSLRRQLSGKLQAAASASYSLSRSDIESLLPSAVMSSYRGLSYSDSLARIRTGRASASLNWEDNVNMFYAGLTGSAFMSSSDRMASSLYSREFTLTGYSDADSKTKSYGLSGSVSKFIGVRAFIIEAGGGWNRTDQDLQLQSVGRTYTSDQWNVSLSLRTSPAKWISAEVKNVYTHQSVSGNISSESDIVEIDGRLSLKPCEPLTIDSYVYYLKESVPGMKISDTPLLKTSASWKFRRFSIVAECRNILGCDEFSRASVSSFLTSSSKVKLRGRQFLLGIRLSL